MRDGSAASRAAEEYRLTRVDHYNPSINKHTRDREVGDYFAELSCALFDGFLQPQTGLPSCDAYLRSLEAYAEVKGRNDAYAVPLKEDQLDRYLGIGDASEHPSSFVYLIWRYQSRDPLLMGGQRHMLTVVGHRRRALRKFLSQRVHSCHLYDIGVIELIRKTFGVRQHTWPTNSSSSVVHLPLKMVNALHCDPTHEVAQRIKKNYRSATFPVSFIHDGHSVSVDVHAVVRPRTFRKLQKAVARFDQRLFPL